MNTKFGRELKKGDFIIIACEHSLELGFYVDRGKGGSLQYYTFYDLINWKTLGYEKHPVTDYIKCPHECKIARYTPQLLNDVYLDLYRQSIEILKLLKIREA